MTTDATSLVNDLGPFDLGCLLGHRIFTREKTRAGVSSGFKLVVLKRRQLYHAPARRKYERTDETIQVTPSADDQEVHSPLHEWRGVRGEEASPLPHPHPLPTA